MNIIVLCGGISKERDVSLVSGIQIARTLRELGHKAVLIDIFFGSVAEFETPAEIFSAPASTLFASIGEREPDIDALFKNRGHDGCGRIGRNVIELCRAADLVFMAIHGDDGEDGRLQAMFDLMDIKYTGSGYLSSAVSMNKNLTKQILRQNGILTPDWVTLHKNNDFYKDVGFPCVVKPCSGGSSVGTSLVFSRDEYSRALKTAFECEPCVIVEKYIAGRECDVGILGNTPLPVIEICVNSGFFDYRTKYQKGAAKEICPARLPHKTEKELQETALFAFHLLGLSVFSRMDFIIDENGNAYCLEANSLPGMTPESLFPKEAAAAGLEYADVCRIIIEESLKKYS